MDAVFDLPLSVGLDLIIKARTAELDEWVHRQWCAIMPFTKVSFADYKAQVTGSNIDRRSSAEILAEVDEIENMFKEEQKKNADI